MLLHEFDEDLVFALELGFELFDLAFLGILDGLGLAAVVEGQVGVLEEQALPLVEAGGVDVELIAQVGDGDPFEEVSLDDGDLVLRGEMAAGCLSDMAVPPYRLC